MGRYVSKINNTYAEYGDYCWDYIKQNKPKEYYDKSVINVSLEEGGKEYNIDVPVSELVDIKLVKKYYKWEWSDEKSLARWLFNFLQNRGERVVCEVTPTLGAFDLKYDKPAIKNYYLQSEIGDDDIILTTKPKQHEIKNFTDFEWLRLRYLRANF